jgi:hypothetical protein
MDKHKLALFNEAINSKEGQLIVNILKDYMVELAGHPNSNSDWLKGVGMALGRLNDIQNEYQKEKLKERI